MDNASQTIYGLRPVSFRYKAAIDPSRPSGFGLIAEDVDSVASDLVLRDKEGKPYTVRYDAVNAMLLNEFVKQHRKVEERQATITELKEQTQTLVAQLKEQAVQIQKVSAQLATANGAAGMRAT